MVLPSVPRARFALSTVLLLALAGLPAAGQEEGAILAAGEGEGAPAPNGGLVLCTNLAGDHPLAPLVAAATRVLAPNQVLEFTGDDPAALKARLAELRPECVVVLAPPETLDLTFHLKMLALSLDLDGDPFPDFHLGYLTAADAAEGGRFIEGLRRARALGPRTPRLMVDVSPGFASKLDPGSPPSWCPGLKVRNLLHAHPSFLHENAAALEGIGLLRLSGSGSPWGIESGATAGFFRDGRVRLHPAVVVAGGDALATADYYWPEGPSKKSSRIGSADAFLLGLLSREPGGLLLSFGPGLEEGANLEIERLCLEGDSLGGAWKAVLDSAILTASAADPKALCDVHRWDEPAKTAAASRAFGRAIFGDPRQAPFPRPLAPSPARVQVKETAEGFDVACAAVKPGLFAAFSDPFGPGGGRVSFTVPLPSGADPLPTRFVLKSLKYTGRSPKRAAVRVALERWAGEGRAHVLILFEKVGGNRVFRSDGALEVKFALTR